MSREIKFRAWHKGASEIIYDTFPGDALRWQNEGQPVEVMQFTGLKDKNGKEIYEGDILKYSSDGYHFELGDVIINDGYTAYRGILHNHLSCTVTPQYEVIANIYQNPELLTTTP